MLRCRGSRKRFEWSDKKHDTFAHKSSHIAVLARKRPLPYPTPRVPEVGLCGAMRLAQGSRIRLRASAPLATQVVETAPARCDSEAKEYGTA